MKSTNVTKKEKETRDSVERGEWVSVQNLKKEKERFTTYARHTLKKDKRINIRISSHDLLELQKKAINEGLPYQTLISSILHKFADGKLVDTVS